MFTLSKELFDRRMLVRVVLQKVNHAAVSIDDEVVGKIGLGYFLLVGFAPDDTEEKLDYLVHKITNLRVFEDENQKMNLSIQDIDGELLIVSQFTLYANSNHGNRPSFTEAAKPDLANELYEYFVEQCKKENIKKVATGEFGADMQVSLQNDGPVTIILEKENV